MTRFADAPLALMDRWFSPTTPFGRFVAHTALFSALGLLLFLVLYITVTPGLWGSLIGSPIALQLFARQVIFNGFVTVFIVNYAGFSFYVWRAAATGTRRRAVPAFLLDVAVRIALFFLVTAASYVAFALAFGSFGGEVRTALAAVGTTIALAAGFGNLSGVYLYATAVGNFPLFAAATIELMETRPTLSRLVRGVFFFLPFAQRPILSVAVVFAVFVALFATLVSWIAARL